MGAVSAFTIRNYLYQPRFQKLVAGGEKCQDISLKVFRINNVDFSVDNALNGHWLLANHYRTSQKIC